MKNLVESIQKIANIFDRRLKAQGARVTAIWLYARGIPLITGVPILKFSKITDNIYVGPQYRQRGKQLLEELGIRYGINMRVEFDDAAQDLALPHYCHLPTIDDDAPTIEHLQQGIAFMQEAHAQHEKVYIHCAGGIGRAPTMAAAYLVHSGMTLGDAIHLIEKVRPFIHITPPQMAQLERLAQGKS